MYRCGHNRKGPEPKGIKTFAGRVLTRIGSRLVSTERVNNCFLAHQ